MKANTRTKTEPNPFIRLDSIKVKMIPISPDGGRGWKFLDDEQRINVYPREFLDKYDAIKTNTNCRELLIFIMEHLSYESDKIQLLIDKVSEQLSIPRSTLYDTIDKLESLDFIRRTGKRSTYWINPYIMFKGSRVNKYPEALLYEGKDVEIASRIKRDLIEAKYPQLREERRAVFSEEPLEPEF
jgi:hypothetical protein